MSATPGETSTSTTGTTPVPPPLPKEDLDAYALLVSSTGAGRHAHPELGRRLPARHGRQRVPVSSSSSSEASGESEESEESEEESGEYEEESEEYEESEETSGEEGGGRRARSMRRVDDAAVSFSAHGAEGEDPAEENSRPALIGSGDLTRTFSFVPTPPALPPADDPQGAADAAGAAAALGGAESGVPGEGGNCGNGGGNGGGGGPAPISSPSPSTTPTTTTPTTRPGRSSSLLTSVQDIATSPPPIPRKLTPPAPLRPSGFLSPWQLLCILVLLALIAAAHLIGQTVNNARSGKEEYACLPHPSSLLSLQTLTPSLPFPSLPFPSLSLLCQLENPQRNVL